MIVAITGGTGFIGRKLVEQHLTQGDEVRVISRRRVSDLDLPDQVKLFQGDLTDGTTDLAPFIQGTDILYHCAGEIIDPDKMYDAHIVATERLIVAAAGQVDHWVQLSSVAVYGPVTGSVSEESSLKPSGEYGETKVQAEKLVAAAATRDNFSYSILRPANVFGQGMNNQSLFHIIAAVNRGYFFFVGPPGAKANYIHVADVVRGMMACGVMSEARNQIYNLSRSITMEDFVAVVAAALDKPVPKLRLPERPIRALTKAFTKLPGFPLSVSRVDALTTTSEYVSEKIERDLGYRPRISLPDGLRQLVEIWSTDR